ncbi:hypothetical protein BHM03_00047711, partial [Ensete ventricosum]
VCDFRGSCQPYCRYLPQDSFLDFFDIAENSTIEVEKCNWDLGVQARLWYDTQISLSVCEPHEFYLLQAVEEGFLLKLPFTTIFEYLQVVEIFTVIYVFCKRTLTFTRKQLETDPDILLQKAAMAMRKYGMHIVVANELATYKKEVSVVTGGEKTRVCSHGQDHDLEEELIDLLVARHSDHIKKSSGIDMN